MLLHVHIRRESPGDTGLYGPMGSVTPFVNVNHVNQHRLPHPGMEARVDDGKVNVWRPLDRFPAACVGMRCPKLSELLSVVDKLHRAGATPLPTTVH